MKKPELRKITAFRHGSELEWIEAPGWAIRQTKPGGYIWSIIVDHGHNIWHQPTYHENNIRFEDEPVKVVHKTPIEIRRVVFYHIDKILRCPGDPEWKPCDAIGIKRQHDNNWTVIFLDTHHLSVFVESDIKFDADAFSLEEGYFDELYNTVKSLLHPKRDELDDECAECLLNEIDGDRLLEELS